MAKETKTIMAYAGVDVTLDTYGAFGWKLLSASGTYGLKLEVYRDTEHPHYAELVKAEQLYEERKEEYSNLPRPVEPEKPGFFNFKGKKEYEQKMKDFYLAQIQWDDRRRELSEEMKKIVKECRLNYILD